METKDPIDAKVALAHDWLNGMRGGERVLELLANEYSAADIYTLLHQPGAVSPAIESHSIHVSFLMRLPGILNGYRYALPLFPLAVRGLKLRDADLLISTSHCVAKSLRPGKTTRHLCYCFTPMRYAWTFYEEYFGTNPLKKAVLKPILAALRHWDRATAEDVDRFVAISKHVQKRILQAYGRDSLVIYPPVDTERCTPSGDPPEDFDLIVSALVPYKRVDLAVEAYRESGRALKIIGTGTEYERLMERATPNIELLGWKSDEEVLDFYRRCRLLVFPGEEDFGIVPVEAQACGRPVVAYGVGGALETVLDGETGLFFSEQSSASLQDAVERALGIEWDALRIRRHAEGFRNERFLMEFREVVRDCLKACREPKATEILY